MKIVIFSTKNYSEFLEEILNLKFSKSKTNYEKVSNIIILNSQTDLNTYISQANTHSSHIYILDEELIIMQLKSTLLKIGSNPKNKIVLVTNRQTIPTNINCYLLTYFPKTLDSNSVLISLNDICEYLLFSKDFLVIKINNVDTIIHSLNIVFIEYFRGTSKVIIHCNFDGTSKSFHIKNSLSKIGNSLSASFSRVHKSYIANLLRVKEVDYTKSVLCFDSGEKCRFSKSGKKAIQSFLYSR